MKILIIGDPLETLRVKTDTGLAMSREALDRGHTVTWSTPQNMAWVRSDILVRGQQLNPFERGKKPTQLSDSELYNVLDFDTIWIRKDPPFDVHYLTLCWFLIPFENRITILNSPSVLAQCHEKFLPFIGVQKKFFSPDDLVPTLYSIGEFKPWFNDLRTTVSDGGPLVRKPWFGYGGHEVQKFHDLKTLLNAPTKEDSMYQPMVKGIETKGDRRVWFINGEALGTFVRVPKSGTILSNLASGGTAHLLDMTSREKSLVKKLEKFLKHQNIFIAGVDLLDEHISEINITSPTGFETYRDMTGTNLTLRYVEEVEKRLSIKPLTK